MGTNQFKIQNSKFKIKELLGSGEWKEEKTSPTLSCSLLPAPCSLLPAPYSLIPNPQSLIPLFRDNTRDDNMRE